MAYSQNIYKIYKQDFPTELRFVFFSTGKKIVTKVIVYTNSHQFEGREVYNLGFGDYILESDAIEDKVTTNNSDAYKVFNTVLSTVPLFFEKFPDAILMVQGSDSSSDFAANCRRTCHKKCGACCKNLNQRVSIYRNYIEKHFFDLSAMFWFLGSFINPGYHMVTEKYIIGKKYQAILMFRK